MGKLDGKVAVITGATSGMALAGAKLFVEEGAYVFITGRRQEALDQAVAAIGRNVTGVQGDAADLEDLDRLFETVEREKGSVDVLYTNAGIGPTAPLGAITEELFDETFRVNNRGTLFAVQKALPLFNDGGSIIMTASNASIKGWPGWSVYAGSKAALHAFARVWLARTPGPTDPCQRPEPGTGRDRVHPGPAGRSCVEGPDGGNDPARRARPTEGGRERRALPRLRLSTANW